MRLLDNINYNGSEESVLVEEVKKAVNKLASEGVGVLNKDMLNDALVQVSGERCLESIKYLINQGADISTNHNHPVRTACLCNYPEIVRFFAEHGADIEDSKGPKSLNAVQIAFISVQEEILKYFIEDRGISVNAYDNLAIECAIARGRIEVVKYLRSLGAHIDDLDIQIRIADERGSTELVDYLRSIEDNG
jgi:ankyrin repeat protein